MEEIKEVNELKPKLYCSVFQIRNIGVKFAIIYQKRPHQHLLDYNERFIFTDIWKVLNTLGSLLSKFIKDSKYFCLLTCE